MGLKGREPDRPRLDAETLAALLDDTLSEEERRQSLDVLSSSDADFEVLADAAAALGALESEQGVEASGDRKTAPGDKTTAPAQDSAAGSVIVRSLKNWKVLLPLAAGIGAVAILPRLSPGPDTADASIWADFEAIGARAGQGLRADLGSRWDQPGWTVTRGSELILSDGQRAFRIGVRLAQLAAAVSAGDDAAATGAEGDVDALLSVVEGGGLATTAVTDWTARAATDQGSAAASWRPLTEVMTNVLGRSARFELGILVERTRLSVLAGTVELGDVLPTIESLMELGSRTPRFTADAEAALARTRQAIDSGSSEAFVSALEDVSRAVGG